MHALSFFGYSAWITVDGKSLPVYEDKTSGTTCSGWVPSTAGQNFSVWWKDDSKSRIATSGHVFVDGRDVASAIMRPGRSKPVERLGAKTSSRTLKPFKFSVLRLTGISTSLTPCYLLTPCTDDETVANRHDPALQDMGVIKIEISRVKLGSEVPFKGYETQDQRIVHEKAKKLGAHCTSYGASRRSSTSRTVAVTTAPYDPNKPGPFVTFMFKYRSEDLLRAKGIIGIPYKRNSPNDNDEIIVISDSETDKEKSKDEDAPRVSKRARLATDEFPSAPPQSDTVRIADEIEQDIVNTSHGTDLDMTDSQSDFSTPILLQQDEREDDSQTLDDDGQLDFGVPSLLQESRAEEGEEAIPAPQSVDGADKAANGDGKGGCSSSAEKYPRTPQKPPLSPWRVTAEESQL